MEEACCREELDVKEDIDAAMNIRRVCLLTLILVLAQLAVLARCQEEGGKNLCREREKKSFLYAENR